MSVSPPGHKNKVNPSRRRRKEELYSVADIDIRSACVPGEAQRILLI
jgi:hypothetical protein